MIHLDLIQCISCDMFCCLLKVTDSCCICEFFNHCIQCFLCYNTFFLFQAHTLQDFRKCKFGKDDLFFLRCVIWNINHCKTRHQRCTDPGLVIGCCDRIYTNCRDHTLHVIICKSKVIQKCQKYICRISVTLA